MPASGVPQDCQTPSVPQAALVPALGAQGSPKAELGSRVPFPCVLSWGVREQCGAGLGFVSGIPPPAQVWRRMKGQGAVRGPREPGHCVQGSWGAWVRGRRYSPCPPSCLEAQHSLLVDPEALGVLEGQESHGDPGDTAERTGWVAGAGQEVFPVHPCSKGWTCPCPAPTHQQDKGTREHEDMGTTSLPSLGSCPSFAPSIRILPADQGDLVVPYVLAVPAETKPVVSIPCELVLAWFGGCRPPKATSWWQGVTKALTASPRSPFSPCKGTEGRG